MIFSDPSLDIQPSTSARIKASGRAGRTQRRGVPIPVKTLAIGTAVGLVATDLSDGSATRNEISIGLSLGDSTHARPFGAGVRMRAAALVCADDPITTAASGYVPVRFCARATKCSSRAVRRSRNTREASSDSDGGNGSWRTSERTTHPEADSASLSEGATRPSGDQTAQYEEEVLTPTENRAVYARRVLGLVATLHQNSERQNYGTTGT